MIEKKITIPLSKYIQHIIRYAEWGPVNMEDALLISEIDKEESICHVQFESLEDGEVFIHPHVWYIKCWKTYHIKNQLDKAKQAQQRKEWNLLAENTTLLMKSLAKQYGIDDPEILRGIATKMAKSKNQSIVDSLGIKTKLDLGNYNI